MKTRDRGIRKVDELWRWHAGNGSEGTSKEDTIISRSAITSSTKELKTDWLSFFLRRTVDRLYKNVTVGRQYEQRELDFVTRRKGSDVIGGTSAWQDQVFLNATGRRLEKGSNELPLWKECRRARGLSKPGKAYDSHAAAAGGSSHGTLSTNVRTLCYERKVWRWAFAVLTYFTHAAAAGSGNDSIISQQKWKNA